MTIFLATTTVNIFRGEIENILGDSVAGPTLTPVNAKPIPFSIIVKTKRVFYPETAEWREVRYGVGRCAANKDFRLADRLKDTRTGKWWVVEEVTGGERSIVGQTPLVFELRQFKP